MPKTIMFNLNMVFQKVEDLSDFNVFDARGNLVPALGKDYFVINNSGQLESYRIRTGMDHALLKRYRDENRLYIFDRMASVEIDPSKVITCLWNDE